MENHKERSEASGHESGSWSAARRWRGRNPRAEKDPEGPRRRPGASSSHLDREVNERPLVLNSLLQLLDLLKALTN